MVVLGSPQLGRVAVVDVLWWLQAAGAVVSLLMLGGALAASVYATVRETPTFFRRLTGTGRLEDRLDRLHADHRLSQHLQLQQAESYNELIDVVCEQHEIPKGDRPPGMNVHAIREELMGREETDFTRGGSRSD